MTYRLPANYRPRTTPTYDDDVARIGNDVIWQPDVIPAAVARARDASAHTLIDIGCGNCTKLAAYDDEFTLVGIDHPSTVERLRSSPNRPNIGIVLIPADFDSGDTPDIDADRSWIIASDIIEHLVDPTRLTALVSTLLDNGALGATFSTPDRSRVYQQPNFGPPRNTAHVREWTLAEFCDFLSDEGFDVVEATHTRNNNRSGKETTCLVHVS